MLKKIIAIFFISMLGGALVLVSCEDCGPFPDRIKVISVEWNNYSATFLSGTNPALTVSPIIDNRVNYATYAISLTFNTQLYFSAYKNPSGFFTGAYACSPKAPVSTEVITSIQVFSEKPFATGFAAGNDLRELFDVIVDYRYREDSSGYEKYDLVEYIQSNPQVPTSLTLLLKSPPDFTDEFRFEVKYFQSGVDLDFFEFTTESITIER